jgi:hypothetical protein
MSFNAILKKVPMGWFTKIGKKIILSDTVETSHLTWPEMRTNYYSEAKLPVCITLVEKADVPQGTQEDCMR